MGVVGWIEIKTTQPSCGWRLGLSFAILAWINTSYTQVPSRFIPDGCWARNKLSWGGWVGGCEELEIKLSLGQQKLELGLGLSLAKWNFPLRLGPHPLKWTFQKLVVEHNLLNMNHIKYRLNPKDELCISKIEGVTPISVCQQKEKILLSQDLQISISPSIFEILVQISTCDLYMSLITNGL